MKISGTHELLAKEITIMTKFTKQVQKEKTIENIRAFSNDPSKYDLIPKMVGYGLLVLENYDKVAKTQEEYQENLKLMGYVVMPKYETNLFELLNKHHGLKRLEIILTTTYQLVGIMQLLHKSSNFVA